MTAMTPEKAKEEALARFADEGPGHINCSQAVVHFSLLVLGDDLALETTARYLGGGIAGMGEACGAVTGAALALGLRDLQLGIEDPDLRGRTTDRLQQLLRGFAEEFGSRRCIDLTGFDLSDPEGRKAFMQSDIRKRCVDYVTRMCDGITPMLLDPVAAQTAPV